MNFALNKKDRFIVVQFSFPNKDTVPMGLFVIENESEEMMEKRKERKQIPSGCDLLSGSYPEKTTLLNLPISLVKNGFSMVTATYQKRIDQKDNDKFYNMVRFAFVRNEHEDQFDERLQKFIPFRGLMMTQLQELCSLALWRVRLFKNPYYKTSGDQQVATNDFSISINLEARKPFFERANPNQVVIPEYSPENELFIMRNVLCINKA